MAFNEFDVLKIIASSLAEVKNRAALSHLPSHRIWVRRLHESLSGIVPDLEDLGVQFSAMISLSDNRTQEVRDSPILSEFCKLVPQMLRHELAIARKLIANIELIPVYKMRQGDPARGFEH